MADEWVPTKGRHQNYFPLTTNFSQKLTSPSKVISCLVGDLCRRFTNRLCPLPIHIVIQYHQQMVQMAFCIHMHTYHKQVTNVSPACFCHPTAGNFDVSPKNPYQHEQFKKVPDKILGCPIVLWTPTRHCLTCLIFWSVPLMKQNDKSFIGCQDGAYLHSLASLHCRRISIICWQIYLFFVVPWNQPLFPSN